MQISGAESAQHNSIISCTKNSDCTSEEGTESGEKWSAQRLVDGRSRLVWVVQYRLQSYVRAVTGSKYISQEKHITPAKMQQTVTANVKLPKNVAATVVAAV